MISVVYKKFGLKMNAIWFCNDMEDLLKKSNADIVFFHGINKSFFRSGIVSSQYTLITDLRNSLDVIFQQINKNYRYEINRSIKERVESVIYESNDLYKEETILQNFKKEYSDFTRLKGINNTYNERAIEKYIENGNIILTKAFYDNKDFAQHIYVCDDRNARLLYSVSNFRTEGMDRNLIGRANKYLHWKDIEYLHNHKFQNLDWGGISSINNPNGIDLFKKGFGGQEIKYYNIITGKSLFGKLTVWVKK